MPKVGEPILLKLLIQATKDVPSNHPLPIALAAAVPLWIIQFSELSWEERLRRIKELDEGEKEFCLQMEYVLYRSPKSGESAQAFNNLAKAIALLAFCPGGITIFGQHYEIKKIREGGPGIPLERR